VPDTEAEAPVSDTEAASDTPAEEVPANDS
jgi:hypothetical protein